MARIIFLVCTVAFICGFTRMPPGSGSSQPGGLPSHASGHGMTQEEDQLWKDFAQCKIKPDKDFSFSIIYTPSAKAMNGKVITISGFMVPLDSKEKFSHFLLSRRAVTCGFCAPSRPNEIVEVFSSKPVMYEENFVTISGTLILPNDGKKGIFFQMKNAEVK
jgi:hypothetical protein